MKFAAFVALIGAVSVTAGPTVMKCIPKNRQAGEAAKKKCGKYSVGRACKSNGLCEWAEGSIKVTQVEYKINNSPHYVNPAKPQAVVSWQEKQVEVKYSQELVMETKPEMEYFGLLENEGDQAGAFVSKDKPCTAKTHIRDCNGFCAPAFWIGNGLCDDKGTVHPFAKTFARDVDYMGKLPGYGQTKDQGHHNFNCAKFWNDGGDCVSAKRSVWLNFNWMKQAFARSARTQAAALNLQEATNMSAPALSVVAMAAIAAVAAVAMVARRK
jgi:hypothetical protein